MDAIKKPLQDAILQSARAETESPTRLQFSLRSMMIFTAIVAVVCALLFSFPPGVAAIACMLLQPCLLAALFSGSLCAKGEPRFFCLGAILPTVLATSGNFLSGNGLGNFWSLLIMSQRFGGASASGRPQSFGDYLWKMWGLLQKMGYAISLQLASFLLTALLCGLTAVWTRRYLIKRTAVPAVLADSPAPSNQDVKAQTEEN